MSKKELFDIFNQAMEKIGVDSRENVHSRGLWHQTFHCWVINKSNEEDRLLLQLRHKDKDTYPLLLDISAAGHLLTGETIEDGVRELEEELGISAEFRELVYCGMIAQENVISNNLIDREFYHVFIYESNKPIEEFNFQTDEISGLFFVSVSDFKKLVFGEIKQVWIEGIVVDELLQNNKHNRRCIQLHDLTPNSKEYYQLLFKNLISN